MPATTSLHRPGLGRVGGLKGDFRGFRGERAKRSLFVDDMEVRQNDELVRRLQAESAGLQHEPAAEALAEFLANGADRCRALETGFPPLVGLRSLCAENGFELPRRRRSLFAPTLHLFRCGFDLPASEL